MSDKALQEYIQEQIAKNLIEKYIQSLNFANNPRSTPATVTTSTAVIGVYDPLEESGRAITVTAQAQAGMNFDRESGTLELAIGDVTDENQSQKHQEL